MEYTSYTAKFIGVSNYKKIKSSINGFKFYDFNWEYITITDIVKTEDYDINKKKFGDYYYAKKINPKHPFWSKFLLLFWHKYYIYDLKFPVSISLKREPIFLEPKTGFIPYWLKIKFNKIITIKKQPEVFIPITEDFYFEETLHDVLIRDLKIDDYNKGVKALPTKNHVELTGTVFFKLKNPKIESKKQSTTPNVEANNTGMNSKVLAGGNSDSNGPSGTQNLNKPKFNGLSLFLGILIWLLILTYFWKYHLAYFALPALAAIGWLLSRFSNNKTFRTICGILLVLFSIITLLLFISNSSNVIDPTVKKKEGSVKIDPPKAVKKTGGNSDDTDYLIGKTIKWNDFISNGYQLKYNTSVQSFFETQKEHTAVEASYRATTTNTISYFNKLYNKLELFDEQKIDSIVRLLGAKATAKRLNQIQTAEMVTTFIQEIRYVLVHENTCQKAIRSDSGNSFIAQYHADRKECLANIPGGVQSPYEFLHNLKGDCDTRSLLGYAILKKMNISSSIWVSEAYGHSILGVGLPIGNGVYKTINGLKHYGVELTHKEFRIGMISPQQRDMNNWNIALFYNNY